MAKQTPASKKTKKPTKPKTSQGDSDEKALKGVPSEFKAHPNSVFSQAEPLPKHPPKFLKGLLIFLLMAVIIGGAGLSGWLWWQSRQTRVQFNARAVFDTALANSLNTPVFTESLSLSGGDVSIPTRVRAYDFSDSQNPKVSVSNLAYDANGDTLDLIIIGGNYYVKSHYAQATLAGATGSQQVAEIQANNQWVLRVHNNQEVEDSITSQLGPMTPFDTAQNLVPAPLLIGQFDAHDRQTLLSYARAHDAYQVPVYTPASATIDGQSTWYYKVTLNRSQVLHLNRLAASMLGISADSQQITQFASQTPPTIDVWVSQQSKRVVRYSYVHDGSVYTFNYSTKPVSIDAPASTINANASSVSTQPVPSNPNTLSDSQMVNAATLLDTDLIGSAQTGSGSDLPASQGDLDTYVKIFLPQFTSEGVSVVYGDAYPGSDEIGYQPKAICNPVAAGTYTSNNANSFALVTNTSTGLYCIDSGS